MAERPLENGRATARAIRGTQLATSRINHLLTTSIARVHLQLITMSRTSTPHHTTLSKRFKAALLTSL